jgi:hypothetical protein
MEQQSMFYSRIIDRETHYYKQTQLNHRCMGQYPIHHYWLNINGRMHFTCHDTFKTT